jgi:hypothetical protein
MRTPLTEETDEIYARHISRLTRIVYERIQRWEGVETYMRRKGS